MRVESREPTAAVNNEVFCEGQQDVDEWPSQEPDPAPTTCFVRTSICKHSMKNEVDSHLNPLTLIESFLKSENGKKKRRE